MESVWGDKQRRKIKAATLTWAGKFFSHCQHFNHYKRGKTTNAACACFGRLHLLFPHVKPQGSLSCQKWRGSLSRGGELYCNIPVLSQQAFTDETAAHSWLPSSAAVSLSQTPSCNQAVLQPASKRGRSRRWETFLLLSLLAGCDPPFLLQRPGAGLRLGGVRREKAVLGWRARAGSGGWAPSV